VAIAHIIAFIVVVVIIIITIIITVYQCKLDQLTSIIVADKVELQRTVTWYRDVTTVGSSRHNQLMKPNWSYQENLKHIS